MSTKSKDLGVDGKTIGGLLRNRAKKTPLDPAYRTKKNEAWQTSSWQETLDRCENIAFGLCAIGLNPSEKVGILSNTREEWVFCDFAITMAGGITVPLYSSNPKETCEYILSDSDSSFLFVEDSKQLSKVIELKEKLPLLQKVIMFSDASSEIIEDNKKFSWILSLEQLEKLGIAYKKNDPQKLISIEENLSAESIAAIMYTSGTTGQPKGALITHKAYTIGTRYALEATPAIHEDVQLLFLPLAHSFGKMLSVFAVRIGFCTAFAESIEKLAANALEVRPTLMVCVPRIFEKIYSAFLSKANQEKSFKRNIIFWSLKVGNQYSRVLQQHKNPGFFLFIKHWVADRLVFSKLRDKLGGKIRWFISGSAPLLVEIAEFFHAAGMIILEGYGLTETNSITSVNRLDDFKFGSVGKVHHPTLQVKIAMDGEILTKGITNFVGYYKHPELTQEVFDMEGWFHTGDIGEIDSHGFIRITDRKKDLIKTSAGKFVAPQKLEGLLKTSPLISQAVVMGDRHKYISALIALNTETIKHLFQENNIPWAESDFSKQQILLTTLQNHIDSINKKLGSWEQIKYFRILPKELSESSGELTPSLKIKRNVVLNHYKDLIESMYEDHFIPNE